MEDTLKRISVMLAVHNAIRSFRDVITRVVQELFPHSSVQKISVTLNHNHTYINKGAFVGIWWFWPQQCKRRGRADFTFVIFRVLLDFGSFPCRVISIESGSSFSVSASVDSTFPRWIWQSEEERRTAELPGAKKYRDTGSLNKNHWKVMFFTGMKDFTKKRERAKGDATDGCSFLVSEQGYLSTKWLSCHVQRWGGGILAPAMPLTTTPWLTWTAVLAESCATKTRTEYVGYPQVDRDWRVVGMDHFFIVKEHHAVQWNFLVGCNLFHDAVKRFLLQRKRQIARISQQCTATERKLFFMQSKEHVHW